MVGYSTSMKCSRKRPRMEQREIGCGSSWRRKLLRRGRRRVMGYRLLPTAIKDACRKSLEVAWTCFNKQEYSKQLCLTTTHFDCACRSRLGSNIAVLSSLALRLVLCRAWCYDQEAQGYGSPSEASKISSRVVV